MLREFVSSAGVRIFLLPVSGLASLLVARTISNSLGAESYGVFALVAALPLLVPFADLGLGAAVTNAAAKLPLGGDEFVAVMRRAQRILWKVAAASTALVVTVGLLGLWPTLIGVADSSGANVGISVALVLFAASVPAGLGARVLVGLRKNTLVTTVQTVTAIVSLAGVLVASSIGADLLGYLPFATLGAAATTWFLRLVAARRPEYRTAFRQQSGMLQGVAIWNTAAPMLILSVLLPITYQSERLIVSLVAGASQLAIYSAAALLFLPALSVIQVATRSFWGEFGAARSARVRLRPILVRALLASTILGVLASAGYLAIGKWVGEWAVAFQVEIPFSLIGVLSVLLLANAVHLPSGMFLTDAKGLKFQAVCASVAAIVALPASIWLCSLFGAVGPPAATLFSVVVCQLSPCLFESLRRTRTGNDGMSSQE